LALHFYWIFLDFPSCTFIWSYTCIRNSRVLDVCCADSSPQNTKVATNMTHLSSHFQEKHSTLWYS
jgi:hypothetical protein